MTLYEIVTQRRPFHGTDLAVLPGVVREGKRPPLPVLAEEKLRAAPAGAALLGLMAQCWAQRAAARPRFRFLEHQLLALLEAERKKGATVAAAPAAAP